MSTKNQKNSRNLKGHLCQVSVKCVSMQNVTPFCIETHLTLTWQR